VRDRILLALTLACLAAASPPARAADESTLPDAPRDVRRLHLFRFEFDNDAYLGNDDAYTAGWSLQLHSRLHDVWSPANAKWIGQLPGLGDDGSGRRIVRWAAGISQSILTPEEITNPAPQPQDTPWAGLLGVSTSWSAYDNRRLAVLQVYAGCMGPCSGAEAVQRFVHEDLGMGATPQGWGNQLANRALGNLNYEYRYKLYAPAADRYFTPGRFAQDVSVGSQAGVGNLVTFIQAQVEYRLGWGLPMGFTKVPDPPGWGVMLDPIYIDAVAPLPSGARAWRAYFTLFVRSARFGYMAPAEGGETVNGGSHSPLRPYPGEDKVLAGFHAGRVPFGFHLTYYRYFDSNGFDIKSSSDWINLSFEYQF
jgi:hypothetical protein